MKEAEWKASGEAHEGSVTDSGGAGKKTEQGLGLSVSY